MCAIVSLMCVPVRVCVHVHVHGHPLRSLSLSLSLSLTLFVAPSQMRHTGIAIKHTQLQAYGMLLCCHVACITRT